MQLFNLFNKGKVISTTLLLGYRLVAWCFWISLCWFADPKVGNWEFAYALCMMVFWYAFYSQRLLLKVAKNRILTDIQKCSFFSPFSWFWSWISLSLISPHSGSKKLVMAAEVQIYCIQSRKAAVAQELKFSLRNGFSSMLGEFLYLEELCK